MDGFSDRGSIPLISILDFHVMAIVAKSREIQHIPRIDWVCAFFMQKKYRMEFLWEFRPFLFIMKNILEIRQTCCFFPKNVKASF